MQWEIVIGLETHAQLSTQSKIFSGAAIAYGAAPNTQACAVDLALPGVLPVFNRVAAEKAVKFGLAINARINRKSVFERKNYFYPDLPKGYQISQLELPIVAEGGTLRIQVAPSTGSGSATSTGSGQAYEKEICITRAHLEEDAGKSLHEDFHGMKQWFLVTDNQESETHLYALKLTNQAPRLVKQPESQSVAEGETATFAGKFDSALFFLHTRGGIFRHRMNAGRKRRRAAT